MTDQRYPIGPFELESEITKDKRQQYFEEFAAMPDKLREAVRGLSSSQLDTPHREGGWTVRQVVHHIIDSHVNAYVRFKLALTEENPVAKSYDQARWSELEDSRTAPVEASLSLVEGLYQRWVFLLKSLNPDDFAKTMQHPDRGLFRLDSYLGMCVWHGEHHIAQIRSLRNRNGW